MFRPFQLFKFSFTYSVKDLGVYDYFSRNYGHVVNHGWQWFFFKPEYVKIQRKSWNKQF